MFQDVMSVAIFVTAGKIINGNIIFYNFTLKGLGLCLKYQYSFVTLLQFIAFTISSPKHHLLIAHILNIN